MTWRRYRVGLAVVAAAALLSLAVTESAEAAVSVSRAEVSGSRLKIEGRAAVSRPITVDGVQMATSSSSGSFKVDRSGYTPPADCTVDVNDGSATPASVRLSGCTVTTPTPTPTPTPSPTPTPAPEPTPAPAAALASLGISPASLQGGGSASLTLTLTAPAPAGGAEVTLSSSDPAVVVPATRTVPAGVDSNVVFLSTNPVASSTAVVVSGTYAGVTRTATVTVTESASPPPSTTTLDAISLSPATVQTGTTSTSATLMFSALTPTGGATVSLTSSNPALATVPASVTVPASSSTGAFSVAISSSGSGTATISATYNGITRSALLTVQTATLFRIITESPLPNATVGQNYAGFIEACCGQGTPYRWSLVSGTVPDGLRFAGDDLRLTRTTGVTGVPTRVQTTTFTVRARDGAGNTATKTFTLTVNPPDPLTITNTSDQLKDGQVGVFYETGVFPGGGVPPYTWSRVAGTLPPGLAVQASPGRVRGTPTTAGDFTFTLRVDDSGGQFATRQFSIRVLP
jgi:hypothetical protein